MAFFKEGFLDGGSVPLANRIHKTGSSDRPNDTLVHLPHLGSTPSSVDGGVRKARWHETRHFNKKTAQERQIKEVRGGLGHLVQAVAGPLVGFLARTPAVGLIAAGTIMTTRE